VVARLAEKIGGYYIAGIWDTDLIRGLFWASHIGVPWKGLNTCPEYQAPSFSWASLGGGAYYGYHKRENEIVEVTELIEIRHTSVGLNPWGHVRETSIVVEGPVTRSWIRFPETWDQAIYVDITCQNDRPGPDYEESGLGFRADAQLTASPLPEDYIVSDWSTGADYTPHRSNTDNSYTTRDWYLCQCLLLCTGAVEEHEYGYQRSYLVLALSLHTPGAFERLGLYTLDKSREKPEIQQRAVRRRLTIV